MTLDFNLVFSVDRINDTYQLLFTDQTDYTVSGVVKGFYKIEYPDGLVYENTDTDNPDFTDTEEESEIFLRLIKTKLITGTYVITQKIHLDGFLYSLQRSISLTFQEPTLVLSNNYNLTTPSVSFLDTTNYVVAGYTESKTRVISCDFPATAGASGTIQTPTSELFMVDSGNYYEGVYEPLLNVDSTYVKSNHSVNWVHEKSFSFDIRRVVDSEYLIGIINNFKTNSKTPKDDQDYQMIMSLYSHILGKIEAGESDIEDLVEEILEIATGDCGCDDYEYSDDPLSPFNPNPISPDSYTPIEQSFTYSSGLFQFSLNHVPSQYRYKHVSVNGQTINEPTHYTVSESILILLVDLEEGYLVNIKYYI